MCVQVQPLTKNCFNRLEDKNNCYKELKNKTFINQNLKTQTGELQRKQQKMFNLTCEGKTKELKKKLRKKSYEVFPFNLKFVYFYRFLCSKDLKKLLWFRFC